MSQEPRNTEAFVGAASPGAVAGAGMNFKATVILKSGGGHTFEGSVRTELGGKAELLDLLHVTLKQIFTENAIHPVKLQIEAKLIS